MIIEAVRSIKRSDYGHGCATRRAGEERASAPIRALVAVFVALLAVHFMSGTAYADGVNAEIISGPSQVPILEMYGASIAAPDRYTAAALLMGYGPDAISGWDDDVKAKLSNEGTGGQFYIFANNSVQNYFDITEHTGIFQQFFDFVGGTFWNVAQALYGNNLWAALYTSDELAAAKADLERVLSGEDIGGGSGGSGDYYVFEYKATSGELSGVTSLYIPKSAFVFNNDTSSFVTASGMIKASTGTSGGRIQLSNVFCAFTNDVAPTVTVESGLYSKFKANTGTYFIQSSIQPSFYVDIDGTNAYCTLASPSGFTFNSVSTYAFSYLYQPTQNVGVFIGGGSQPPVVPPTNWPEPQAPEPPELPEPGDPVVEPPEPYDPGTGPTYIWNITNTSEPTDTSDLLEWIKKIFYELKAIHSDLKTWFENLGMAMTDGFEAMDNACGQIYAAITEQTDDMISQFSGLKTYLKQLFEWLGDKMSYQYAGYDDTSVIYWLKRIWSKLGNGDINVRPTDPTTDPTGVWDWLIKLIQNFLIGLASSANDLISEMADLVSQVMHEFPFSIPWDIAAYLAAFAAAPITPDVDVTIPAIEGWWGETVISIDLSPYDTAAAAVRAMEKILFAALLAWKSRDLLEFMDVTKWFNG